VLPLIVIGIDVAYYRNMLLALLSIQETGISKGHETTVNLPNPNYIAPNEEMLVDSPQITPSSTVYLPNKETILLSRKESPSKEIANASQNTFLPYHKPINLLTLSEKQALSKPSFRERRASVDG
jgi:hypothetical protein